SPKSARDRKLRDGSCRWGASGTVAKTISAYDKEVSDDLYGSGPRYVSKQRLQAMLDNEWTQLVTQLGKTRGPRTRFFCFVDTVAARNFSGTNDSHGWVGLRFQLEPGGPPNDVALHINMRDPSNLLQQQAIGILGVNLIYAAFFELQPKEAFLEGLAQNVVGKRIEIDYIDLRGQAFETWDRRALLVHLVRAGLAEAVYFPSKGPAVPPTEVLYKKAIVLAPGYFGHKDPVHSQLHWRLLASATHELEREFGDTKMGHAGFFCLTVAPLKPEEPAPDVPGLLDRIDALLAMGGDVLLFHQPELYHMTALVNRHTQAPVRFAVGLSLAIRAFEDAYENLEGRRLEAIVRLFAQNFRIYVYPMTVTDLRAWLKSASIPGWDWSETEGWVSASQLRREPPLGHLFAYLLASNFLVPVQVSAQP
ncbi:MAG TPA: hypothetical protein VK473_14170, partial [Terriglobales bacterium]|nr:hypothetical protein [Terriglobales bacterium]